MAKKPCSDFHADRSKTVAAKARGALFLRGVSERSERQNFLIAYNLPRTAKNTCAKNHDDRSNDATRRGKHTNKQTHKQTNKPMSFYNMIPSKLCKIFISLKKIVKKEVGRFWFR